MRYPGLTYIGNGKLVGLYGLNETIHDQKSLGLQHLYIDNYENDYIYSALSVVKENKCCYYGDQIKPIMGHPQKIKSAKSYCEHGYIFVDEFNYERFDKKDRVYCPNDYALIFECEIKNTGAELLDIEVSSLIVTTKRQFVLTKDNEHISLMSQGQTLYIETEEDRICRASKESPSGFMYRGIQNILYEDNIFTEGVMKSEGPISISLTKKMQLKPQETYIFKWNIATRKSTVDFSQIENDGKKYWDQWLKSSHHEIVKNSITNLIALKAMNMGGFVPADLTGHYFASNNVSFYVRDALHAARAFLYSGYYAECKEIIECVHQLPRKSNHEIYQRYNARLIPDEGANNNVFSQIDFIGYLLRVVSDYYHLTQHLLISIPELLQEVNILESVSKKHGLYGPEGGVNEGVYGPAYITSTNIFIAGGLIGLVEVIHKQKTNEYDMCLPALKSKIEGLIESINDTYMEENYFAYGYVDYDDKIVKRYDTPQLFGASLGYPMDKKYIQNFYTLSQIATYFKYGYGYSEQQYHDGPWIFNTAFAAQNAYILEDTKLYHHIMQWLEEHKNAYGLLPEAVDARNEEKSFINPLMWANAEYICAEYVDVVKKIRKEVPDAYKNNKSKNEQYIQ